MNAGGGAVNVGVSDGEQREVGVSELGEPRTPDAAGQNDVVSEQARAVLELDDVTSLPCGVEGP